MTGGTGHNAGLAEVVFRYKSQLRQARKRYA